MRVRSCWESVHEVEIYCRERRSYESRGGIGSLGTLEGGLCMQSLRNLVAFKGESSGESKTAKNGKIPRAVRVFHSFLSCQSTLVCQALNHRNQ